MAVKTYNNEIARAYSQGANVAAIYSCGKKVWSTEQPQTYHIRGTSTATTETLKINNVNVVVDVVNGAFDYEYSSPLRSLSDFAYNNNTITSVDFTDADDLQQITSVNAAFYKCNALIALTTSQTFENAIDATNFVNTCPNLQTIELPNATFANTLYADGFLATCPNLQTIELPNATFENAIRIFGFIGNNKVKVVRLPNATFENATYLGWLNSETKNNITTLYAPKATFGNATSIKEMFLNYTKLTTIDLSSATFGNAIDATNFMNGCSNLQTIELPNATFASLQNATGMFASNLIATKLDLSNANFSAVTTTTNMMARLFGLTTFLGKQNSMPKSVSFVFQNNGSPLTYQSMINVCNWLANVTTTQTITFKSSAWAALTADQQNTLTTIATAKNWTIATA